MGHKPTPEQATIIDGMASGGNGVIEAGAGTGKTSTLEMLARTNPRKKILYVAYNKAIAGDAAKRFPSNVSCRTSHSLAYAEVGKRYVNRLNGPRVPARQAAKYLGIYDGLILGSDVPMLSPTHIARLALDTVNRFAYSADTKLLRRHVPRVNGLDADPVHAALQRAVLPFAERAWEDLIRPDGKLKFTHDYYLKLWGLSLPFINADMVLLDEAQDANPVIAKIVEDQGHAQLGLVGDRCQAIYSWRGAIDAMRDFVGTRYVLSQSFRFGQDVADEANKWLNILNAELRLTGFDQIPSRLEKLELPDAVLCWTNARAVETVMEAYDAGRKAALVGGGEQIKKLAEAAIDLKAGRGTSHPELFAFTTWAELKDYVEHDSGGSDLAAFVRLVNNHEPGPIIEVCDRLVDEKYADVVVSTSHRAKGREWGKVRIADDFKEPKATKETPKPKLSREDAMLAYVAVTRAKLVLDRGGLSWVDNWGPGGVRIEQPAVAAPPPVAAPEPAIVVSEPAPSLAVAPALADLDDGWPVPTATAWMPAPSTCTCDTAEAARWSDLIGQPAGRHVARCARCGGGMAAKV